MEKYIENIRQEFLEFCNLTDTEGNIENYQKYLMLCELDLEQLQTLVDDGEKIFKIKK